MGFLDDIFGTPKPRVTDLEYREAKNRLHNLGFDEHQRNRVDQIFKADYDEATRPGHARGLEKDEIDARIKWMRDNKSKHGFSDEKIDILEKEFKRRL